ncbi:hypothetical protein Aple_095590 [Acrocarpospora pleiomorpha]|uniref:Secreted protein n=1 Tax=Acrocarpospora pleiomorpha TaxID=90975 RepID=A0A5M3Y076_9ACTN|nr:hypothetical protein [Acrocarpospora pleiomorpha]GES26660.1 hypothetical protein Aple_095590 [Acrocarpospora pleiomorpha]
MHLPRAIGYTLAWCGATALAVTVAWLGVGQVLHATVLGEEPLSPLLVAAAPTGVSGVSRALSPPPSVPVTDKSTPRPSKSPTRRPTATPQPVRPTKSAPETTQPRPKASQSTPTPTAPGEVLHTFTLRGGRATIAVREQDCRMVSATPADGYELKVWEESHWLRITFLQGTKESSAFCTWNALPPRLDTYEN